MIKKITVSLLVCCLSLAAFAKGGVENPNSKWKKLGARVSSYYTLHHGGSHAKKPSKVPFVVTSLDWDNNAYSDSTEKYVITWNQDSTAPVQVVVYSYNNGAADEKLVIDSFKMISGGEAFNELEFLGDWLPVQAMGYEKVGSAWLLFERITITNTTRGIEQILYEDFTGTAWENSSLEYYLFDTQDMPLGYLSQEWENGDWVNTSGGRVDYTYDNGIAVQADHSIMKDHSTDWEPVEYGYAKEVYNIDFNEEIGSALIFSTFGTDNTIDSIGGIVWHDFRPTESGFLSTGGSQYSSYTQYQWDRVASIWNPFQNYSKTYNGSGMETEEIVQTWDGGSSQWVNESRTTWDYYPDGEQKEVSYYSWNGSAWTQSSGTRYNNSYDNDNDLLEQTVEFYNGTGWEKSYKTIYRYTDPSGIADAKALPQVKFYPNPAVKSITVELPASGTYTLKIVSLTGQVVSENAVSGQRATLDVSKLNAGPYILSLESGSILMTSRFVKQ